MRSAPPGSPACALDPLMVELGDLDGVDPLREEERLVVADVGDGTLLDAEVGPPNNRHVFVRRPDEADTDAENRRDHEPTAEVDRRSARQRVVRPEGAG